MLTPSPCLRCFLAKTKIEGLLSITAMEDLRADGYFLAKKRTELDKDHVMVALRAIGRYHAFSYAAKVGMAFYSFSHWTKF